MGYNTEFEGEFALSRRLDEKTCNALEELADVLMYFNDVLLCYDITAEELKSVYEAKFRRNMTRW